MRPLVLAAGLLVAFAAPAAATPTWLAPQDLSIAPATGTPSSSVVASDAAGETFAAWDLTDGTNVRVQLAMHAPGQPWSAATNLSDAGADASAPSLSLSSTGYGAIAWTRSDGAHATRPGLPSRHREAHSGPPTRSRQTGVDASNAPRRDRCRGRRRRDLAGPGQQRRARAPLHGRAPGRGGRSTTSRRRPIRRTRSCGS